MRGMRFIRTLVLLFVVSTAIAPIAHANPISFKDGYGIMSSYSEDRFDTELNYSLTNRHAVGISTINLFNNEEGSAHFQFAQFNYLIKRWNELESQANIYISSGLGARHLESDDAVAGLLALEGDYETRRIYTSLLAETLQSESDDDFNRLRYRAGIAPYLAPFKSLQTWLITQIEYTPELEDRLTVTAFLRFFYNNLALEAGASVDGKVFVGTMIHF